MFNVKGPEGENIAIDPTTHCMAKEDPLAVLGNSPNNRGPEKRRFYVINRPIEVRGQRYTTPKTCNRFAETVISMPPEIPEPSEFSCHVDKVLNGEDGFEAASKLTRIAHQNCPLIRAMIRAKIKAA